MDYLFLFRQFCVDFEGVPNMPGDGLTAKDPESSGLAANSMAANGTENVGRHIYDRREC